MVNHLQWDSDFFGLRIGRSNIASEERWKKLLQESSSLRMHHDLIYIFSDQELLTDTNGMHLVDIKILKEM